MKICVIGTGYVGLVVGAGFSETGNIVRCVDVDKNKIDLLQSGNIPIYEPGLLSLVNANTSSNRLFFSTDVPEAIRWSEVIFLCVGTPEKKDGSADLSSIVETASIIAENINHYKVIVCKSTVPVGTNELITSIIKEKSKSSFAVVSNPEFLKEGDAVNDFMKPDRVVIGTNDDNAKRIMHQLYLPLQRTNERIIFMDPRSAELTKYISNAYLATRITFINEMANICDSLGADIASVRMGAGSDSRIGLKYFYPGCGYGGSCFPKDVQALIHMARNANAKSLLLEIVDQLNDKQKLVPFEKLRNHYNNDLKDRRIAVWGLSFKPETDDIREAPSISIISSLLSSGSIVLAYDPIAIDSFKREFGSSINYCLDQYAAVENADALIITTEWKQFRSPDFKKLLTLMNHPVIIDGRNIWSGYDLKDQGFIYYGIGLDCRVSS